jgi:type I restriction enzyme S subunit
LTLPADTRTDGEVPVFGSNGPVGFHSEPNTLAPVLVIGRKGSFGKITFSDQPCFAIDTTYFIDVRNSKVNLRWLFYTLLPLRLDAISEDSAIPGLSRELTEEQWLPVMSVPEQCAIATFLDRETARINDLIAKKERLIELLQEKRAALISHAVTKGLDPTVPMKDSGVEWLGEIPAHWDILLLKRVARIRYGLGQPPVELDEGKPLVRATNVKSGTVASEGMLYIDPIDIPPGKNAVLSEGEIIVVRSGAYTGDSAIIPKEFEGAIAGYDMVVTVTKGYSPFIAWQLLSKEVRDLQFGFYNLRAAQSHLNAEDLGGIIIVVPPLSEQHCIASYLDSETAKIDALISRIRDGIEKLKEYSTALISSAVTGKIDVRGEITL